MSTTKEKSFDYRAYIKKNPPGSSNIRRGFKARTKRFEAAVLKSTVQIEEDILERFRELTPGKQDYEKFINQALREWLATRDVKEFLRAELYQMVQEAISSTRSEKKRTQAKSNKPLSIKKG